MNSAPHFEEVQKAPWRGSLEVNCGPLLTVQVELPVNSQCQLASNVIDSPSMTPRPVESSNDCSPSLYLMVALGTSSPRAVTTKYHKPCGLKQHFAFPVLEAGSIQSRCQRGEDPLEISREERLLASSNFWWPQVFPGLWQCHLNLHFTRLSSLCVCPLCPVLSSQGHHSLALEPTLNRRYFALRFLI